MINCIFCNIKDFAGLILIDNESFFVKGDKYPVSEGHLDVISKRHIESFLELDDKMAMDLVDIIKKSIKLLDKTFEINGYNIGLNEGSAAGKTIDHFHLHIIPRYKGDVQNPTGGVRNVIPEKGDYTKWIKNSKEDM